jgi:hypothetical protein
LRARAQELAFRRLCGGLLCGGSGVACRLLALLRGTLLLLELKLQCFRRE